MADTTLQFRSALISVYHKTGLDDIVKKLHALGVEIYSTGGTYDFLENLGIPAHKVEDLTSYPSILGGRVKTLHPKVFGGILGRRENTGDIAEMEQWEIPNFDLVVIDLYPFEETVQSGASPADIIEKIDIGGISLIRAAAKNFNHVVCIPSQNHYDVLNKMLMDGGKSTLQERQSLSADSFEISSRYDFAIWNYLSGGSVTPLRYGENPHQSAIFIGRLDDVFTQLSGKELSYNNLVDVDAALALIAEVTEPACCVIKHTNPCGFAIANSPKEAWQKALSADSVSAFGGIIAFNKNIDLETAVEVDKIFFEICLAPSFSADALELLSKKKNRMLLQTKGFKQEGKQIKSILGGKLLQDFDTSTQSESDLNKVTTRHPSNTELKDLIFANKIVKHAKSNTIVLVKDEQLIGIGVGQTSRVDALQQALAKAQNFGFDLQGAVMSSDAFFPFPDCVEIADKAGITAVIHPGGSIRDNDSIAYCNAHNMAMVTTGIRHFKH